MFGARCEKGLALQCGCWRCGGVACCSYVAVEGKMKRVGTFVYGRNYVYKDMDERRGG